MLRGEPISCQSTINIGRRYSAFTYRTGYFSMELPPETIDLVEKTLQREAIILELFARSQEPLPVLRTIGVAQKSLDLFVGVV